MHPTQEILQKVRDTGFFTQSEWTFARCLDGVIEISQKPQKEVGKKSINNTVKEILDYSKSGFVLEDGITIDIRLFFSAISFDTSKVKPQAVVKFLNDNNIVATGREVMLKRLEALVEVMQRSSNLAEEMFKTMT